MLKGIDVSHWQTDKTLKDNIKDLDFVIVKATEGKTYTDPLAKTHISTVLSNNKLLGLYHYARPENNTPEEEVNNFLHVFENYVGKAIPFLDWEEVAWNYSLEWAYEWLRLVYDRTGIKPLIYISASHYTQIWNIRKDFEVWVASYGKNTGEADTKALTRYDILNPLLWQYTSNPIDKDYFYGDMADWELRCKPDGSETEVVVIPRIDYEDIKKRMRELVERLGNYD